MKQQEIIAKINEVIVEKLSKGVNPWKKPWSGYCKTLSPKDFAINYVSGEAYSGINQIVLEPGYYVSYKQALDLGGKPAQGKGHMVVFSSQCSKELEADKDAELLEKLEEAYAEALANGEAHEDRNFTVRYVLGGTYTRDHNTGKWTTYFWVLKEYYVWNIEDCAGIRAITRNPRPRKVAELDKTAEEIIEDYAQRANLKVIREYGDRAYYTSGRHEVHLPLPEQFKETGELYSTTFHELGHSTGHASLLNRPTLTGNDGFGGQVYSKEELVAEITAAYSVATLGIDTDDTLDNSVAYLKSWAEHIQNDKSLQRNIISATTEATKAFKLIFNIAQ
jgi:antirestriction protein ArdC